jgi:ankyrin repeat protein
MNSFATAQLLIKHCWNVNCVDKSGSTPLHIACANGIPEIIPLLLSNGARIDPIDIDGKTPLQLAQDHSEQEQYAACLILLRRWVDGVFINPALVQQLTTKEQSVIDHQQSHSKVSPNNLDEIDDDDQYLRYQSLSPQQKKDIKVKPFVAGSTKSVKEREYTELMRGYGEPQPLQRYHKQFTPSSTSPLLPSMLSRPKSALDNRLSVTLREHNTSSFSHIADHTLRDMITPAITSEKKV